MLFLDLGSGFVCPTQWIMVLCLKQITDLNNLTLDTLDNTTQFPKP